MSKPKLLFISTRPPYPLLSGEKNKTFNEIKILSKKFRVFYCSLCPASDKEEVEKLLSPFCEEVHLFSISRFSAALRALGALITGEPLQIGYFSSGKLKNFVHMRSQKVDALFVNLFRAVQFVPKSKIPAFLDMSDSISEHYRNAVKVTTSIFWRWIYSFESKRMRAYEERHLGRFKKVFLFNPQEMKLYQEGNLVWIPHGVNDKVLNYPPQERMSNNKVSFLGKMDYRPNVEAVKWFVQNVLPYLDPKFSFQIIGAFPSKEVLELASNPRVEVTGFVDDPYLMLCESHCVVAPMVSGGGIQNKLLESMAIGCANVVTSICARPLIDLKDEVAVTDEPQEMAKFIQELTTEKRREMGQKARQYIQKNYTWKRYEGVLFQEVSW